MALVAHSGLPAFSALKEEGVLVVDPREATGNGKSDLSIGLLNLMPDAALRATDRQFIRLASAAADRYNLWIYPFTVAADARGVEARSHIRRHYSKFEDLRRVGLDALVVSGANPARHELSEEPFWDGLVEVLDWAETNTHSVLCSCLATHGVLEKQRLTKRVRLPDKMWGVYEHQILDDHPLLAGVEGRVDAPHSHLYDVSADDFEATGARVLAVSDEAGVHMAVSEDEFYVFFQGHPEYEPVSLLKEYKREVARWHRDEREDFPPLPEHYFDSNAFGVLDDHRGQVAAAKSSGDDLPVLKEVPPVFTGVTTWTDPGQTIYRNWLTRISEAKHEY